MKELQDDATTKKVNKRLQSFSEGER
jgi:hypothetical protein